MGDVNKEQLSLWKCEVRGPKGMCSPQLPTASPFLSPSSRRFVRWLTGVGHRCGLLAVCVQALLWRILMPNTLELARTKTWDETRICYLVKLLPSMFCVWIKVFLVLLTLCLFFLLFSDKRNQAETLVFQNKYPDWTPHKLHMVCIIDLFSWELAKKSCWSQGRPSLISPQCQGCLRYFTCRLFVFLLLGFVPFPSFLSLYVISPFPGCGRADGNLFSPSEMTPRIAAETSGDGASEPPHGVWSCFPKSLPSCSRGRNMLGLR